MNRRQWIQTILLWMITTTMMTPTITHAAATATTGIRGAAELDLEFYVRDLFHGHSNERMGNIVPSPPPPPMKPPRTITNPLLDILLILPIDVSNDMYNYGGSCTIRALIDTVLQPETSSTPNTTRRQQLQQDIQQSIVQYQNKVSNSFYQRAPWQNAILSDQYYFDMMSYTIWKTASMLLPSSLVKSQFVSTLGQYIYQCFLQQQLVSTTTITTNNDNTDRTQDHPLTSTNQKVLDVLNVFTNCGFIQSYRIGSSTNTDKNSDDDDDNTNNNNNMFDIYDDEALVHQASVDVLLSVYESATLGACLQWTGEQSRFQPDYIGPTLLAMWYSTIPPLLQSPTTTTTTTATGVLSITYETYFLDSTYRPNPKGTIFFCFVLWFDFFFQPRVAIGYALISHSALYLLVLT
jgi:hypothetical protein